MGTADRDAAVRRADGSGQDADGAQSAKYLFGIEDALLRYDLSEFADPWSYAKLCGRQGQHGEPGLLVQDVNVRPLSVGLLDEIEKAHPSAPASSPAPQGARGRGPGHRALS